MHMKDHFQFFYFFLGLIAILVIKSINFLLNFFILIMFKIKLYFLYIIIMMTILGRFAY
jgi:hypothetical protein